MVVVKVQGANSLGNHVTGTVAVAFTGRGEALMAISPLSGAAAIVGIGATEFSKNSGRTELQLACEAIVAALADAGIDPSEVDGLSTYTSETNGEILVARNCGLGELKFFSRIDYGGGAACATVQQAAMAVATGVADVVVCLPRVQRTLRCALRPRAARSTDGQHRRSRGIRVDDSAGIVDSRSVGRDVRPPVHAPVRCHE